MNESTGDERRAAVSAEPREALRGAKHHAIETLAVGVRMLELGSGGGFDAPLAAGKVGPKGRVVGVDVSPEAVARASARTVRPQHVEYGLGERANLAMRAVGYEEVRAHTQRERRAFLCAVRPGAIVEDQVAPVYLEALKPDAKKPAAARACDGLARGA